MKKKKLQRQQQQQQQSTANTQSSLSSSPYKRTLSERKPTRPIPDRWGICESGTERIRRLFVGEYKAAHKVPFGGFAQVLSASEQPPEDHLFLKVLRRNQSGRVGNEKVIIQERVAQVLCHYI